VTLPRWTAYVSLGVIFAMAIVSFPRPCAEPSAVAVGATEHPRFVVLGIDGLDPEILADVMARYPERMASFRRLADEGGVHVLGTSTPPQSPVAWSNFITGRNPGGHGIYDFLHRDPLTRTAIPSTATAGHEDEIELWGDWQLPRDEAGASNRSGKAFWTLLREAGVPADVWRMPANFPVEPSAGLAFSGMMSPAIDSAYGECTFYTTDPPPEAAGDSKVVPLSIFGERSDTFIAGPPNSFKQGRPTALTPMTIFVDRAAGAVALEVGDAALVLEPGEWSEFVQVSFEMLPLGLMAIGGEVRFYLRSIEPELELYASPVNIDPLAPVAPVSEPESASAELADRARGGIGPYYTQGMPEDVNALKRDVLDDAEFMAQADLVQREGEAMMDYALDKYLEDERGGLLFFYFSGVDLCGHMMWRHADESHPHHDARLAAEDSSRWSRRPGSTWRDVIDDLYLGMDPVLGHLRERVGPDTPLVVMSDHGFASYARKFSLNTWLLEDGYLVLKDGRERELSRDDPAFKRVFIAEAADWSKTRAYGIGFNGLFLNLAGRELDDPETPEDESGIVQPGAEAEALLLEIKAKLEALRDDDGTQVVLRADLASTVFAGERVAEAPDLVVGYNSGYGNSDEASLGRIPNAVLQDNDRGGTFNGSHLMAPDVVAGVLLTNLRVRPGAHALEDLTVEVLARYGIEPDGSMQGHRVLE
jgi:predicted AlkP superfamily phosphohydrolase/phosphomutase